MTGRAIVCAIFLTLLVIPVSAHSHDHNGHTAHAPHAMPNVAPGGDMGAFPANIGGPFRLRDADGRNVDSRQDFTGRVVMLFLAMRAVPEFVRPRWTRWNMRLIYCQAKKPARCSQL